MVPIPIPPDDPGDHGKFEGDPIDVVVTPAAPVERSVDGGFQEGAGSIVVPDGVLSFSVSVLSGGSDPTDTSDWVTLDGPDFAAAVPLKNGQTMCHRGDMNNTLAGPFTVTVPAGAAANASWSMP